jgi:hypothetical protein
MSRRVDAGFSPSELASTEQVYRTLAAVLSAESGAERVKIVGREQPQSNHVRFLIDVVSGTSAGGINGVILTKALACGEPLQLLERLWVEEGELGKLINDSQSRDGVTLPRTCNPFAPGGDMRSRSFRKVIC